eukprot:CAMPEP_0201941122 /NCGR_PEP_ID=MMETSP0903-20130614/46548_1 /ASSEMBLY_ACC=CAM_ASM_000552 /TAXON_ID=420261 /ORGANISM="Thalassiosira antarctica, Strain CCMP982" /LENGTH=213 /DNA_ID=CAMNT_0048483095 /DNA_START=72 /DNA_END=711 /DNA_ORIENTATION=+
MEAKIVPEILLHPIYFYYYSLLAFVGIPSIELTSKATVIVIAVHDAPLASHDVGDGVGNFVGGGVGFEVGKLVGAKVGKAVKEQPHGVGAPVGLGVVGGLVGGGVGNLVGLGVVGRGVGGGAFGRHTPPIQVHPLVGQSFFLEFGSQVWRLRRKEKFSSFLAGSLWHSHLLRSPSVQRPELSEQKPGKVGDLVGERVGLVEGVPPQFGLVAVD